MSAPSSSLALLFSGLKIWCVHVPHGSKSTRLSDTSAFADHAHLVASVRIRPPLWILKLTAVLAVHSSCGSEVLGKGKGGGGDGAGGGGDGGGNEGGGGDGEGGGGEGLWRAGEGVAHGAARDARHATSDDSSCSTQCL